MDGAKRLGFALAIIGALFAASGASADAPTWIAVETLALPAGNASQPSIITIERSDDAMRRLRVTVRRPSGETIPEMFGAGLVPLGDGLTPDLRATNRLRSDYVFVSPKLDRLSGRRVLILFGGPAPPTMALMIVGSATFETYGGGVFMLTKIVRGGGGVELIGRRAQGRALGRCRETYAPYAVQLFIGAKDSSLAYSPPLSRAYNRAHYVWAGPRARADLTVDSCGARQRLVR